MKHVVALLAGIAMFVAMSALAMWAYGGDRGDYKVVTSAGVVAIAVVIRVEVGRPPSGGK